MNLSFDIRNSGDLFLKLQEDYHDFQQNPTSARIAINCAMTAWHLSEWVYHEFLPIHAEWGKKGDYQEQLKKHCPSLQIMHDIANGSKHYKLTSHKPHIEDTKLHEGAFSDEFSREFDVSTLDIEMKDGTILYFEDEIACAVNFWKEYIESLTCSNNDVGNS